MCGGSILSERIILTAAHCVVRDTAITDPTTGTAIDELYHPKHLAIHVGDLDITQFEAAEKMMSASGIIVHEEYDSTTVANDIAMIILSEPIGLGDSISAIALPETADRDTLYADGAAVTVIGKRLFENCAVVCLLGFCWYVNLVFMLKSTFCKNDCRFVFFSETS